MNVDKKFKDAFNGKIGQIFLYLVDRCNLRCIQCLYKTELTFQLKRTEIPFHEAISLMVQMYNLGATKVTFMGGEPTLYQKLPELISVAKQVGYSYVRIDTNGMFDESILDNPKFQQIDEITFSIDGYDPQTNDLLRGKGVFNKCLENILAAVSKNYNVHTTSCVHSGLVKPDKDTGELGLIRLIRFLKGIGVNTVDMHDLLKSGMPRDTWSGNVATTVPEYMYAFAEVQRYISSEGDTSIRMPQCVIEKEKFSLNPEYYGYCSVKQHDRILAFPNGMLRVCSLMTGTPYCIAYYDNEMICWNNSPTNELFGHELDVNTKCTNQGKGNHFNGEYIPLCVSFKPKQVEQVWINHLHWEDRCHNNI